MKPNERKDKFPSIEQIKDAARGREIEILEHVAGIPAEILEHDRQEYPCPKCGGNTRCRLRDRDKGKIACSHCFPSGDFIAAVRGVELPEALRGHSPRLL